MTREDRRDRLFILAAALPEPEREPFLHAECGSDLELLDDLLSLLAADAGSAEFVERSVSRAALDLLGDATNPAAGKRVGAYVLERLLGSGGMGAVYLARRADEAFDKRVAIKLIRVGIDSREARLRFLTERQILARLEHPFIARLLDGGTTDDGAPYVVMEYVEGKPITVWADEERLDVGDRLRLFLRVCEAVQHAHEALIVHRDVKPSNVLITGDRSPRLIDFGIAKLMDAAGGGELTQTGMRLLTPEYASPEQLRGEPVAVATDVYSLGVVLYELLTGQRPFDRTGDDRKARERAILDTRPRRPSTAVAVVGADSHVAAANRRSDPRKLSRRLRGDLDTIVLTAVRREPSRRYGSVGALADDVRRYLARDPVAARPDTLHYRTTRFIQRHWVGSTAAMLAAVALAAGSITGWAGLLQARVAQERAEESTDRAEAVSSFLAGLLSLVDPDPTRGQAVTVREVLDTAVVRLRSGEGSSNDPEVEATLLSTIGESYLALGALTSAKPALRRALDIRTKLYGRLDVRVLETETRLGEALWRGGDIEAALASAQRVLEARRLSVGESDPLYASALMNVGLAWRELGRYRLAEPMLREAIAISKSSPKEATLAPWTDQLTWLATILSETGRSAEAIGLHEEALAQRRRTQGEANLDIINDLTVFVTTLDRAGRLEDAEVLAAEAIRHAEVLVATDHPLRAHAEVALARVLQHQGRLVEAERSIGQALDAYVAEPGTAGWRTALARGYQGQILLGLERPEEAHVALEEAWSTLLGSLVAGHPRATDFALEVASLYAKAGQRAASEAWLRRAEADCSQAGREAEC